MKSPWKVLGHDPDSGAWYVAGHFGSKAQAEAYKRRVLAQGGGPLRVRKLPAIYAEPLRAAQRLANRTGKKVILRRNPEWLQGTVARKLPSGHELVKFYDSQRKMRGEMFTLPGESPKFLLEKNPSRRRRR